MVGQLAGGIAHDFNNVLSAIMMANDFLLNAHKPTDPSFQDIMQIKQNATRAATLVRQLLAFSRKQTLRPQVLDLGDALSDLTMLLRRLIGEKVKFDPVHARDLWPVKADVSQFEQVIVNLAVNARDAMPDGGKLTIKTANVSTQEAERLTYKGMPPADYVRIDVADTGTGIPVDIVDKIFEPFFSTKEVGKGTGLGLSTVYGIVKQTGGFVYVDSEPGKGTTFHIFLPRYHPEQEAQPEPHASNGAAAKGSGGGTEAEGGSHRSGYHPAGGRRGGPALAECTRPALPRLHRDRGIERHRGAGGAGAKGRSDRSRGVRRGDAGNGWSHFAAGDAGAQSRPQDHLRLGICGRRICQKPRGE